MGQKGNMKNQHSLAYLIRSQNSLQQDGQRRLGIPVPLDCEHPSARAMSRWEYSFFRRMLISSLSADVK
jgi:hypothetical protein